MTSNSVLFTVISNDYFDGPGSTIKFSIKEKDDGFYISKRAVAVNANFLAARGVEQHIVDFVWAEQARRLKAALAKYGN